MEEQEIKHWKDMGNAFARFANNTAKAAIISILFGAIVPWMAWGILNNYLKPESIAYATPINNISIFAVWALALGLAALIIATIIIVVGAVMYYVIPWASTRFGLYTPLEMCRDFARFLITRFGRK